jgi:CII-binding regulator of phage lambda lysogenization HflD
MAELPFQQPQTLNERQNRALALAAVFQSAQLTHMTALSGQQSIGESGNFYLEQLIKASLNIRPKGNQSGQTLDFFHQLADISLGLKTLESSITQPFNTSPKTRIPKLSTAKLPMTYAMALLQLEKKVYSNPKFVEIIEQSQQKILRQLSFSIITIYTQASLPTSHKPMSTLLGKLTHALWCEVMQKHLKTHRIPTAFELPSLLAYKWHIYGVSSVEVHGAWCLANASCLKIFKISLVYSIR